MNLAIGVYDEKDRLLQVFTGTVGHSACIVCEKDMPVSWEMVYYVCGVVLCYEHVYIDTGYCLCYDHKDFYVAS